MGVSTSAPHSCAGGSAKKGGAKKEKVCAKKKKLVKKHSPHKRSLHHRGGAKKCPAGEIKRKGYQRKSYVAVTGAHVKKARVPASCVKDRGAPGKGPKILPKVKAPGFLREAGYSLSLPETKRHSALRKAAHKESLLEVLRRLNLVRNYSKAEKKNYVKLSKDVEYLKKLHLAEKKKLKK